MALESFAGAALRHTDSPDETFSSEKRELAGTLRDLSLRFSSVQHGEVEEAERLREKLRRLASMGDAVR